MADYIAISYGVCVATVVAFALYAAAMFTARLLKQKAADAAGQASTATTEDFITARRSMGKWRIAWSFFASAVGAWCITGPTAFAVFNGIIGLLMYAIASGFPILVIALFGDRIRSLHPDVSTLSDYVGKRYGPVFKTMVVLISLFNMSIAMLAEYVTIGALFQFFVGSVNYPIIIVIGLLTLAYTTYGGLYVSIVTDQAQGICTILLIFVIYIFIAVKFRPAGGFSSYPLKGEGFDYGPNPLGYGAIFSMPCSLMAATVFSEAMWQKVWASEDRSSVVFGGVVGSLLIMFAVFMIGWVAWLAAVVGWVGWETNYNLYMFQMFLAQDGGPTQEMVDASLPSYQVGNWVGVITLILAVTMNESAIDSLQNGIAAVVSNHVFKRQHVMWARLVVVLVNVPIMIVAIFQELTVLQLFHITNVLTSCCFIPVGVGLSDRLRPFVSETCAIFGCCIAMITTTAYGIGRQWNNFQTSKEAVDQGAYWVWYEDITYSYDIFLVASGFSVVGMVMWAVPAWLLKRFAGVEGPGVTGLLKGLPGFKYITGEGLPVDLLMTRPLQPLARLLKYDPNTYHSGNAIGSAPPDGAKLGSAKVAGAGSSGSDSGSDPEHGAATAAAVKPVVVEAK